MALKMIRKNEVLEIIEEMEGILLDNTIPKNVRFRIKSASELLKCVDLESFALKIDKSLQELDEVSDDPNVPIYAKTQIWNVVSMLERCNK